MPGKGTLKWLLTAARRAEMLVGLPGTLATFVGFVQGADLGRIFLITGLAAPVVLGVIVVATEAMEDPEARRRRESAPDPSQLETFGVVAVGGTFFFPLIAIVLAALALAWHILHGAPTDPLASSVQQSGWLLHAAADAIRLGGIFAMVVGVAAFFTQPWKSDPSAPSSAAAPGQHASRRQAPASVTSDADAAVTTSPARAESAPPAEPGAPKPTQPVPPSALPAPQPLPPSLPRYRRAAPPPAVGEPTTARPWPGEPAPSDLPELTPSGASDVLYAPATGTLQWRHEQGREVTRQDVLAVIKARGKPPLNVSARTRGVLAVKLEKNGARVTKGTLLGWTDPV